MFHIGAFLTMLKLKIRGLQSMWEKIVWEKIQEEETKWVGRKVDKGIWNCKTYKSVQKSAANGRRLLVRLRSGSNDLKIYKGKYKKKGGKVEIILQ